MPVENLEEEGLKKIPDLEVAQLKFLLTLEEDIDRNEVKKRIIQLIEEKGKKSWLLLYYFMRTSTGIAVSALFVPYFPKSTDSGMQTQVLVTFFLQSV